MVELENLKYPYLIFAFQQTNSPGFYLEEFHFSNQGSKVASFPGPRPAKLPIPSLAVW